jgi:uncharacterized protein YbaR (Trm112 family)
MSGNPDGAIPNRLSSWVDQLACPACLGALRFEADHCVCIACGRAYPIVDGIPELIEGRIWRSTASN